MMTLVVLASAYGAHCSDTRSPTTLVQRFLVESHSPTDRRLNWKQLNNLSPKDIKECIEIVRSTPKLLRRDIETGLELQTSSPYEDKHIALLLLTRAGPLAADDINILIDNLDYQIREFMSVSTIHIQDESSPAALALLQQGPRGMDLLISRMSKEVFPSKIHALGAKVLKQYYGDDMALIRLDYELEKLSINKSSDSYVNLFKCAEKMMSVHSKRPRHLDRYLSR